MWKRLSALIRDPSEAAPVSWCTSVCSRRTLALDARAAASLAAAPDTANCSSIRSRSVLVGHAAQPIAQRGDRRRRRPPDERAAGPAAPGLHQALLAQRGEGFAQRHGGDAELRGELGLGRQLLTVDEQAELYRLAHPLHDLVRPPGRGEGRDQRYGVPTVRHELML